MTIEATPTHEAPPASDEPTQLLFRILDRLDALERKVDRITAAAEPVPKLVSGAVDTMDDLIRSGQARGIDVDARIASGLSLIEHASAPATSAALVRLLDRADLLADAVDRLAELPHLTAMSADMVDGFIRARQADGVDMHATLRGLGELAKALTRPETMAAARKLSERLPELAKLAEDGPKLLAMAMDAFDEISFRAAQQGFDVDAAIKSFLTMGVRITEVLDSPQFKALLESDVLAPETLEIIGRAGRALTEQSSAACGRTGVFGALGATRDEDIQRALYFAIGFAQRFGQKMNCAVPEVRPRLTGPSAS